jgi:DNA-binding CsgD family transcriptional regulator
MRTDPIDHHDALIRRLPATTRLALLHAALWLGGAPSAEVIARAVPDGDLFTYAPAERCGLISIQHDVITFRHPRLPALLRRSADPAEQRSAHRGLAAVLGDDPGRRDWHLASALVAAPAERARLFRRAAASFTAAGRFADAARSSRLAGQESGSPADLLAALESAYAAGDAPRVAQIWAELRRVTADPEILGRAACTAAAAMILAGHPRDAFATVTGTLTEVPRAGDLAARLLSVAGLAVLSSGSAADRERLLTVAAGQPAGSADWALFVVGAAPGRPVPASGLPSVHDAGVAAWLRDDPRTAVRLLHDPLGLRSGGPRPAEACNAVPLLFALLDAGQWQQAESVADGLAGPAALGGLGAVSAGIRIVRATLAGLRGDGHAARRRLAEAEGFADLDQNGLLRVLAQRATAIAAVADGDYATATAAYAAMFDRAGRPVWHWSADRLIGEFAVVARKGGTTQGVRRVAARLRKQSDPAPRVRLALNLAEGLVAEPGEHAERRLHATVTDPAGAAWPAERTVARLQYASYLRRQRRFTEATPQLERALEEAQHFGANIFADVVQAEMRANGGHVEQAPRSSFAGLTAQQQHIVRLAAHGLRNREIAERLSMSERTVGSHLYHVYPKLGVSGRNQLREVLNSVG